MANLSNASLTESRPCGRPPVIPNYTYVFPFEKSYNHDSMTEWMRTHWHYSCYYAAVYVVLIFSVREYMKNRPALNLRRVLLVWNIALAIFSIVGFWRSFPEVNHVIRHFGWTFSICNNSYAVNCTASCVWVWLFAYSKVFELGDTLFIVLRKQKLIFLHWYHHVTVLIFTWYSYSFIIGPGRWYIFMNYLAHSLMYPHYVLRSLRIPVARPISITITSVQILQMVLGLYVSHFGYQSKRKGEECTIPDDVAIYGMLMYLSYFVLFLIYFHGAYVVPQKRKDKNL